MEWDGKKSTTDDVSSRAALCNALCAVRNTDGGWGYRPAQFTSAEPTAISCIALNASGAAWERQAPGLEALAELQNPDGSVGLSAQVRQPGWGTGLAVLAWSRAGEYRPLARLSSCIRLGTQWLLNLRGERVPHAPEVFGHDTSLQGWPWVAGTHSWVEPTAYAVMALREAGFADHARVREGVTLLLDRTIPDGGWNYGNARVLGKTLRPFPATTGLALAALAGEASDPRITSSIAYLADCLPDLDAPWSLAWAVLGLCAWNQCPAGTGASLVRRTRNATERRRAPTVIEQAMALWAAALASKAEQSR